MQFKNNDKRSLEVTSFDEGFTVLRLKNETEFKTV